MNEIFLEAKNICKAFDGVQALNDVGLTIRRGETHCLVGENGSGKSTLIKIIGGVIEPDSGVIELNGRPYTRLRAIDSIREGVQIIYQDLSLFPNLTVAENISLNQMVESNDRILNWKTMKSVAEHALEEIGEKCKLTERVENLSLSKRQIIAISRALTQNAKLIIMDEPTSAITREEVDHLFRVIAELKKKGIATLFVSHKLSEVFEIAENVTIIRDGTKIGDYPSSELDNEKLVFLMTGQNIQYSPYAFESQDKEETPLLEVKNLTKKGQFENISFSVKKGEILGITGLLGSGRTEIALSLFGLNKPDSGDIYVEGKRVAIASTRDAIKLGIGYLPEDRMSQGLFIEQPIGSNIIITVIRQLLGKLRLIQMKKRVSLIRAWIEELRIKTPSPDIPANSLSGGNQQRVVIAKWLATNPKVFILDGPTIGIDIGSKRNIHEIIRDLAVKKRMGIIMISDEIQEILQNCNRVLVMSGGRIIEEVEKSSSISEEELFNIVCGKNRAGAN